MKRIRDQGSVREIAFGGLPAVAQALLQMHPRDEYYADAMFLRSIVENIPYMVFVKDAADLRFVRFNRAGEELLGYSRHELIGKSDYDFFPLEEADAFTRADRAVLAGRRAVDIPEEPIRTRNRGIRHLHTKKIPVFDRDGQPRYLLGISEDITEFKHVAAELNRTREVAEAASRAKTDFLARMSHEIRTPMNGIIGMTELALGTALTGEQREYLTMLRDSANSLRAIVNDILDFSKIETGKLDIESVPFDPRDCVEKAVQTFGLQARAKGLRLRVRIPAGVPKMVVGDPGRLRQVLVNLVDNAIRFTDQGRIEVTLWARRRSKKSVTLAFVVSDTGIGIPDDKKQVIFDAFTQADESTSRNYGGTGLGLAISSRLVEMMGGRIWVTTAPGKGSKFHFTVDFNLSARARRQKAGGVPAVSRLEPLRVLVAEDNQVNRLLIVRMLEQEGHKVSVAGSGAEAIELVKRGPVDLVLMDLEMPNVGGLEATRLIRASEKRHGGYVPIVAITAHAMPGYRERCLDAGMDGYIAKPIQKEDLWRAIAKVLPSRPVERRDPPAQPTGNGDILHVVGRMARQEIAQIEGHIRRGRLERVRVMAHNLIGAAGMLGVAPAVDVARALEAAAQGRDRARARVLCRQLDATMATTLSKSVGG
jgi:PAS domain S-box-containing protein